MTPEEVKLLTAELGPILREYVAKELAPVRQRLAVLEQHHVELDAPTVTDVAARRMAAAAKRGAA